jgi:hypothetical protein
LSDELPALEAAFNKAHKQSQKKIIELVEYEDKLARLQAEVIYFFLITKLAESKSWTEIFLYYEKQGSDSCWKSSIKTATCQNCWSYYKSPRGREVSDSKDGVCNLDIF